MKLSIHIIFLSLIIFSFSCYAENNHKHENIKHLAPVESLSEELRKLLSKEMLSLQNGMMSIIPAYASGDWSKIEDIARKMKDSYILKQSLTEQQIKELHSALPDDFIKQDQQFHYFSGMLSHAAKMEKSELVGFYFSKLNEACINCHTEHATHKFPALKTEKETHNHHSH